MLSNLSFIAMLLSICAVIRKISVQRSKINHTLPKAGFRLSAWIGKYSPVDRGKPYRFRIR
jgi:hypothetical protein